MSEIATAVVWSKSKSRRGSRLVLLALAREADDQGRVALTLNEVSRLTGLTVRAITSCLRDLASLGELSRERGGGAAHPNSYLILLVDQAGAAAALEKVELPASPSGRNFQEEHSPNPPAANAKWKLIQNDSEVSSSRTHSGNTPYGSITTQKQASSAGSNLREPSTESDSVEVPEGSKELVAAMTNAGMIVGWRLTGAEWGRVTALAARWGSERLVELVGRRWNADRPPQSARYLLRIWADLPSHVPTELSSGNVVQLRRPSHGFVPFQNTAAHSAYQNGF
ncbi:hypothetical protein ACWCWD_22570 [Streptomyces sp. NPDC001493]